MGDSKNLYIPRIAKWTLIRQLIDFWNSGKYPKGFGEKAELPISNFAIFLSGHLSYKVPFLQLGEITYD
jgi:hypothetical protein